MRRRDFMAAMPLLALGACKSGNQVTVGTKNFTEQLILGELLAQLIEGSAALPVQRRFYLAGTYICHQALISGRIDVYVEYTGTALAAVLKHAPDGKQSSAEVLQRVRREYAQRFECEIFPSLGFNNSFALVMRGDDARQRGLKTISDLAKSPELRLGVGYEFLERKDGFSGLARTYALNFHEQPRTMDLGLLYRALQNRQIDVAVGSNTDGLIDALGLTVLEDDKQYFPPYDAVPIVRKQSLSRHPSLADALLKLNGRISARAMRSMNYKVEGLKRDAAAVAREFLRHELLI